jgi:hypothetical protein
MHRLRCWSNEHHAIDATAAPGGAVMSMRLDEATADRLAKLCGLLGSNHLGERAAAAAKADALVRGTGLTWRDVITPSPPIAPQLESSCDWRLLAAECHARRVRLNQKESDFVAKLLTWRAQPSPRQIAWLTAIHARLHATKARR